MQSILFWLILMGLFVGCVLHNAGPHPDEVLFGKLINAGTGLEYRYESECHIHHQKTIATELMPTSGLFVASSRYRRALVHQFPNSYLNLWSGTCEGPDYPVVRWVCNKCQEAEKGWWHHHR
ncbi:MAG: hypothetical protein H6510_08370 [Acidobacteria bacterium]|nr:hypothetical protein [Acidobacteriota bacterium]MCB9397815.1 hypothetical protein [Acidobacteriota bacterium]